MKAEKIRNQTHAELQDQQLAFKLKFQLNMDRPRA